MNHRKNLVALALLLVVTTLFAAANIGPNSFLPKITPVNAAQCPTGGSGNGCLMVSLSARSSVAPSAGQTCAAQASLSGQRPVCDILIRPTASNATTFRVGAILNDTGSSLTGLFGWQYGILYNTTAVVPQADLSHLPNDPAGFALCAGYPDCGEKTVWFGSQTGTGTQNWAGALSAGNAATVITIVNVNATWSKIIVAYTVLAPNPAVTISARTVLGNIAFEILAKGTTTFAITDVKFVDMAGATILGGNGQPAVQAAPTNTCTAVLCGAPKVTITNDPPHVSLAASHTGTAYTFTTTVSDSDDALRYLMYDFGDKLAPLNTTALTVTHDYGLSGVRTAPGNFSVTVRAVDTPLSCTSYIQCAQLGATGAARDAAGGLIINTQPSHAFRALGIVEIGPTSSFTFSPSTGITTTTSVSFNGGASSYPDEPLLRGPAPVGGTALTSSSGGDATCLATIFAPCVVGFVDANTNAIFDPGVDTVVRALDGTSSCNAGSCDILAGPTITPAGQPIIVDGKISWADSNADGIIDPGEPIIYDTNGNGVYDGIKTYSWNFGDPTSGNSNNATGITASHTFATANTYTVTLNVTDNFGVLARSTQSVMVASGAQPPPTVTFTESTTTATTGQSISLSITASSSGGTVNALKVSWGDGTVDTLTFTPAGTVTATDNHMYASTGNALSQTFSVYVNATDNKAQTTKSSVATKTITDRPPTVSFTESATNVPTGTTITLTITKADPDGTVSSLKVSWGDGTVDTLAGTATTDSHAYANTGNAKSATFTVYVNATDNSGSTTKSAVAIKTVTDRAPTVSFTESATSVPTGTSITLTITASDPDGTVSSLKVSWGDGTVDTLAGTATTDSHAYANTGNALTATFTVYVNATDNSGSTTKSATATKTISDRAPTVSFTESATSATTGTSITLTITAADPDGTVSSLKVSWGDGTVDTLAGTATTDSHAYASTGASKTATFTVYVNATDNSGSTTKSATATKSISDRAPTVSFTESATSATTGTTITLTITSADPDGTVSSLKVSWGDGTVDTLAGTATTDSHAYANTGNALTATFTVYVNATDNSGSTTKSATATKTISDRAPTVSFTESATTVNTGTSITLTITAADPDGTVSSLKVSWGDGTVDTLAGTATTDSHAYANTGNAKSSTFTVYVNATDNSGQTTKSATATKTVNDRAPTVSFTESATSVNTGQTITLTITAADPDGTVSSLKVSWGDGTVDTLAGTATTDSHAYSITGTFTVYVNATDNSGSTTKSATASKVVGAVKSVSFTESTTTATTGQSITLTISASSGASNINVTGLKVSWGDGTVDTLTVTAAPSVSATDSHAYANTGNALSQVFTVYVNATYSDATTLKSSTASKTITDRPPTVSFTESATSATTGTTITLTITAADPDGTVSSLKVSWGDGTVDTLAGTATTDSHAYANTGNAKTATFTVYVNATDNSGSTTKSATATKTISDRAPTVSFTESATSATTGTTITLTITAADPDGTVSSLKVSWGDGTVDTLAGTATTDSHAYANTGNALTATFTVYVNATDNSGSITKSATATKTISDRAPTVSFTESATTVNTGTSITLTITAADPDGTVSSLKVSWGDGTVDTLAGTATTDSHAYANTGNAKSATFTVYVNATDNSGQTTKSATATKTVNDRVPTASFTESATSVNTGQSITLTITAADPDGTVSSLKVSWGDGTVDTLAGTATTDSHAYSITGTFTVYVNATDNSGSTTKSATSSKVVGAVKSVSFTESTTTATTGQSITLTISASSGASNINVTGLKVSWGDGTVDTLTVTAAPSVSATDSHAYANTGNALSQLFTVYVNATYSDATTLKSSTASKTITDRAPTVSFTESTTSATTGTTITLTITAADPDGTVSSLKVSWGDGTVDTLAGTATTDSHAYANTGNALTATFTVYVNATDNSGQTTKSATVTKTISDRAPVVSFTESATNVNTGTSITLTITASDPDGTVSSLKVSWGDGTVDTLAGTATTDSHAYANTGNAKTATFSVYVNATDNSGSTTKSAVATKTVNDRPPTVSFTESATSATTGTTITLTITAADPDGSVASLKVSWGDGTVDTLAGTATTDSHAYANTGNALTATFTVYVNATDNSGSTTKSATATKTISDRAPTVSFTESATTANTGTSITLTITATDPDGTIGSLKVSWGDGTVDTLAGTATTDSHAYANTGNAKTATFTVYVNATDNSGQTTKSATATKTISDRAPTVSFTESATTVSTGQTITLTITAADPDGTVSSLKVSWGDGTVDTLAGTATTDSHAYSVTGTFIVYVNATDNSASTTKSATSNKVVGAVKSVSFTESTTTATTGQSITLTISASSGASNINVTGLKVSWGDGTVDTLTVTAAPSVSATDSHAYANTGNALSQLFTVYVNATYSDATTLKSATAGKTISDRAPTVSFTESTTSATTGTTITLTITAADPDGSVASLKVSWGDGTIDTLAGTATTDSHAYANTGNALTATFTVYVNATDNSGQTTKSATAAKTISDRAPTVSFTESTTSATTGTTITLTITKADPDGTVSSLKVSWGDGTVDTLAGTATTDSHAYANTGNAKTATFTVYVNATDNSGQTTKSATATKTISDRAPTVSFTESATSATTGTTITLTITAADPDGTVSSLKVSWGDGTIDTLAGTATTDSHAYANTGNALTATFTVYTNATDNSAQTTKSSTSTKTISDRAPTASFTESATNVNTGQTITLTITAADPDGTVSSLKVSWGDGTVDTLAGTATTDSHAYSATGTFTVYVNATDNSGSTTKSATASKVVGAVKSVTFTESTTTATTGQSITLTISAGSGSSNINVTGLKVSWGDGTVDTLTVTPAPSVSATDSHAYANTGNALSQVFTVYVNATYSDATTLKSSTASKTISDRAPTVSFTESSTSATTGTTITLTITAADPDGTVSSLKVSWGDGTVDTLAGTATTDSHAYANTGNAKTATFTVYVNATDNSGQTTKSATATKTISDRAPTVSFTESATTVSTGQTITLTITAADPDGTVSSLKVSWGDGTVDTLAGTATTDSHAYSSSGTFTVYVNATDNSGSTTKSATSSKFVGGVKSVSFTESTTAATTGQSITLTISASSGASNVNVTGLKVSWGDGTVDTLAFTAAPSVSTTDSHAYSSTGNALTATFTVYVNATYSDGITVKSATATKTISDRAPTVSFTESATTVNTGTSITLTITAADPDGTVSSLKVSWGDGTVDTLAGTATTDSHAYANTGNAKSSTFTVYVNATDNSGQTTKSATATKTVNDRAPTVSFTESATSVNTGQTITLTITAADPDGTVSSLKVSWGDGTVDTLAGTATTDSHAYSTTGTFTVYVNATDNSGSTTKSATSSKVVGAVKSVSFTESTTTATTGQSITLTISASSGASNINVTGLKVSWGDGTVDTLTVTPAPSVSATDSHAYANTGNALSKVFTVYVNATYSDATTLKSATASKTISDRAPTVSFTESSTNPTTGTTIVLTISAADPDGTVSSLKVSWGDGTVDTLAGTATTDSHAYATANTYQVYVNATDNSGSTTKSATSIKTITDRPPTVSFTESATAVPTGTSITLTITAADPDGTVSSLKVSWGDGTVDTLAGTATTDSHAYANTGNAKTATFTVYVNATDNSGQTTKSATATKTISDRAPTVSFTESTTATTPGTTITLTITATDPDGTVSSLKVSWGDGTVDTLAGTATTDSHAYATANTYQVYVNATDNSGSTTKSTTSTKTITQRQAPTVSFTESATSASTGTSITITITASDPNSGGSISSLKVSWGDGTVDTLSFTPAATITTTDSHAYSSTGSSTTAMFTVYVNATDNFGLTTQSSKATKTITDRPPTVTFTESTTSATTGQIITLTITATDPDGTVNSITVNWGDGTFHTLTITGAPTVTATDTHAYASTGNAKTASFVVTVTVTDNSGSTGIAAATKMITDRPPAVSFAESTTTPAVGQTVTLTISSTDPDGTVSSLKVSWGDGTVDTLAGTATSDTHAYSTSGTFTVYVNATDNSGSTTKSATATKTVKTPPPTVSFTESTTSATTGTSITITITASSSGGGSVNSLKVSWGDGTVDSLPGTATTDSHAYSSTGSSTTAMFIVYVNATDNTGQTTKSATSTKTITDRAPTVTFTENTTSASTGQTITLTISSGDVDGTISKTVVNWGDGTVDTLAGAATTDSHAYANTGNALTATFTVYVNVTDNSGSTTKSATATKTISDRPPTAAFTFNAVGLTVAFDASSSNDLDGMITNYAWDFGDTTTGSGKMVTHTYAAANTYTVTLTVTDNAGQTGTATTSITVQSVTACNGCHVSFFQWSVRPQFKKYSISLQQHISGGDPIQAFAVNDGNQTVWSYVKFTVTGDSGVNQVLYTQVVQLTPGQQINGNQDPRFAALFTPTTAGTYFVQATVYYSNASTQPPVNDPSFTTSPPNNNATTSFIVRP